MSVFRLVVSVLLFCQLMAGNVARAESDETTAKKYFQQGQYEAAKKIYLKAYARDKSSPVLIYNLAVVHYKLQQYPQAKSFFSQLLANPAYRFIARYNLGLVAFSSGHKQQAIKEFESLLADSRAQSDSDHKLQTLARQQLMLLTAEPVKTKPATSLNKPQIYLAAHLAYEDNLVDPLGQSVAPVGDGFLELISSVKIPLRGNAERGLNLGLELYNKDYESFSEYNFNQLGASLTQSYSHAEWLYQAGLVFAQSSYGPDDYLATTRLDLQASLDVSQQSKLLLHFRYADMASRDVLFDAYEGNQQRLGVTYDWREGVHRIKARFELEWNDLADYQTVTDYTSYSATRNKIELSWYYRINADHKLRLRASGRNSEYNDLNTLDGIARDDRLDIFSVLYQSRLSKNWWLEMQYKETENGSNIIRYRYSRNITSLGISGLF